MANPLLKFLQGGSFKTNSGYNKYDDEEERYTTSNTYDDGSNFGELPYLNSRVQETNPLLNLTNLPDNNSYAHNQVRDTTKQFVDNNLEVPKPDMLEKVNKKSILQKILDPLNAIGYGTTNAIKSVVDDNEDTGFFSGFGKGFTSAFTDKREEDRQGAEGILDTLLNSSNDTKRGVGAGIAATFSEGLLGKAFDLDKSVYDKVKDMSIKDRASYLLNNDNVKGLIDEWRNSVESAKDPLKQFEAAKEGDAEAIKYAKENHKMADFAGDILLDPTSFIDGLGKGATLLNKGSKAIKASDEIGDISKALELIEKSNAPRQALELSGITDEALKAAKIAENTTQNAKEAEHLFNKTAKAMGYMNDYEGIKAFGKTVVDAETIAKAGDSIWGKPLSAALYVINPYNAVYDALGGIGKALGNTKLGEDIVSKLPGTANHELVRAMKKTPENAMALQQLKDMRKQRMRDFFFKKETISKNREYISSLEPDVQRDVTHAIENVDGTNSYIPRTVREYVSNPDYEEEAINFLRHERANISKRMAELEPEIKNAKGMTSERLENGRKEYERLKKVIEHIDNMSSDNTLRFVDNLEKYGFDVDESMIPEGFRNNPMATARRSVDEVKKMFMDSGLDELSSRKAAEQIKQAADDTIKAIKKEYPELAPFYTGNTKASTEELLKEGVSSLYANSEDILKKIHEYDEALGRKKTLFAEGTSDTQMETVLNARKKALEDTWKLENTDVAKKSENGLESTYERLNAKTLNKDFNQDIEKKLRDYHDITHVPLTDTVLDNYRSMSAYELKEQMNMFEAKIKNAKKMNEAHTVYNKLAKDGEKKSIGIIDYINELSKKAGVKPRIDVEESNRVFRNIEKARMERKLYEAGQKKFDRLPELSTKGTQLTIPNTAAESLLDALVKAYPEEKWLAEAGDDVTRDIMHMTKKEFDDAWTHVKNRRTALNKKPFVLKEDIKHTENDLKVFDDSSVKGKDRSEFIKTNDSAARRIEDVEDSIAEIQGKKLDNAVKDSMIREELNKTDLEDLKSMVKKQENSLGQSDTISAGARSSNFENASKEDLINMYMENRAVNFELYKQNRLRNATEGQINAVNNIIKTIKNSAPEAYEDLKKTYKSFTGLSFADADNIINKFNNEYKKLNLSKETVSELNKNLEKKISVVHAIGVKSNSGAVLKLEEKMKDAIKNSTITNLDEYYALNKRMQDAIENAKKHVDSGTINKIADSIDDVDNSVSQTIHDLLNFNVDGKKINIASDVKPSKGRALVDAVDNLPENLAKGSTHTIANDIGVMGRNVQNENGIDTVVNGRLKLDAIEPTVNHEAGHTAYLNKQWHVDRINSAIEKDLQNLDEASKNELQELLDKVTMKSKGNLDKGSLTGYTEHIKGTDGKKLYNHEQTSELSSLLLSSNKSVVNRVSELLPSAKENFYKYLKDTPVDEIETMIPKHIPLRDEYVAKAQRFKTYLDMFDAKSIKEYEELSKKHETVSNLMADKEAAIKYFEESKVIPKNDKTREIERTVYDIVNTPSDANLSKDAKNVMEFVKEEFKKMGLEEGLFKEEDYKDFAGYVYHSWNPELINNKKYVSKLKEFGIDLSKPYSTDVFTTQNKVGLGTRKHKGTIEELNKWFENKTGEKRVIDDLISRIYAQRAMYNNELMFKKNTLQDTLDLTSNKLKTSEEIRSMNKTQREAYFDELEKKASSGEYVFFSIDPHYEKKAFKVVDNETIEQGFVNRNATREAMRNADSDVINNIMTENINPFIEIDYRGIKDMTAFDYIKGDKYIMSKAAYNNYKSTMDAIYKKQKGAVGKVFSKFLDVWKTMATVGNPSYYVNNLIGNTFNSYLDIGARSVDPRLHKDAFIIINGMALNKKNSIVRGKTVGEWERIMKQYGVINTENAYKQTMEDFFARRTDIVGEPSLLDKIKTKYNPFHYGRELGEKIESQSRISNFFAHLDEGKSYREAADFTNKYLFDYGDISDFEKNTVRQFIPFYTWMRKNIPLQLESIAKNPNRVKNIVKAKNALSEKETDKQKMLKPEYLDNAIHKGNGKYVNVNLPLNDLQKMFSPKDLVSSINPFLKLALEETSNKNLYFDSPIARTEGEKVEAPNYAKPFIKESQNGKKMMDAKLRYALKSLLPSIEGVSGVSNLFNDDATDSQKEKALGWLEGIRQYNPDFDALQKQELQNYIDKLKDELYNKKKEGKVQPKVKYQEQTNPLLRLLK